MAENVTIDPILIEWIGLCLLVSDQAGPDAFQRWAFTVGMGGTIEERLHRGRIAWVQGREMWGKKDANAQVDLAVSRRSA